MEKPEIIKAEISELLKKMINDFEVDVAEEDGVFNVIIKADEEAPTVIGRHGETIRAIQKILEVILYKKMNEPVRILVNVNDYREKQKEKLESLASELAVKTKETKEPTYLKNMSSYERKIIHEYISGNYPDLTTYSEGEGKTRQLVINLKGNEPEEKTE